MADVHLEMHRDQLEAGIEVETGKTYEVKFGEPMGIFDILVSDESLTKPCANEAYKLSGPHDVKLEGVTGPKGEIHHPDDLVPIDHYKLNIVGKEFTVESLLPSIGHVNLRIPGWPPAEPPAPPQPPPPMPKPDAKKSRADYPNSPEDLRQRYLHMKFKVGDEEVEFTLEKLRYQNAKYGDNMPKQIAARHDLKDKVIGVKNKMKKEKGPDFYAELLGRFAEEAKMILPFPFAGKGSPAQIEAVLKILGTMKGGGLSEWKDKGSLSETMKDFYLNNMGLDCSGFAGNYARWIAGGDNSIYSGAHSGGTRPEQLNPETSIGGGFSSLKKRRELDEIMMGDLMVWVDGSHIATIQDPNGAAIDCIEANGDPEVWGLAHKTRKVKPSGGDLWTLASGGQVYIVSFT